MYIFRITTLKQMKSPRPRMQTLMIRYLLFMGFLHFFISLSGQNENLLLPDVFYPGYIQDNHLVLFEEDTSVFHLTQLRFQAEGAKKGFIDLDTFRHYGHLAIHQSKRLNYFEGLIRTYIGFGWGYVEKNEIDSSLYYSRLAIQYAAALNDTSLLSQAYINAGWALRFKNKEESIENALAAYQLATASKDTSLLIQVTSKLGRIYLSSDQAFNAYKAYSESIELCKSWKDTNSLMLNYFLIGVIFHSTYVQSRQKVIVYEALKYKDHLTDPEALYNLNYLLANWYGVNEQYDSMLYYSRQLIGLSEKTSRIPNCLGRIATVYRATNQLDSARYYLEKLIQVKTQYGVYIDPSESASLGWVEFDLGNLPSAYKYFKKAEVNLDNSILYSKQLTYRGLFQYYDTLGQGTEAFSYLKKYTIVADSMISFQNKMKEGISVLELESTILDNQISLLSKDKELNDLKAEKQRQQKNMVYVGSALMIMIGFFGFYRYRKSKEVKSKQELLRERLRISRELHDEVGATLSGIAMYSHVAKEQVKNARIPEAEHSLSFMQKSAGEMVSKLSDIVWLINPEQDTLLDLCGRLGEYGKQMAQAKEMQMKMDLPSELSFVHVPQEARRNIYLFCKEAINNAVKYSHGKVIELHVKSVGPQLIFSVLDDGNGFDRATITIGNGLVNMQKRAEEIGAIFNMESSPYTGSRVELLYKLIH